MEPFHLHESKKKDSDIEVSAQPYVSFAQGIHAYNTKTPNRCRRSKRVRSKERVSKLLFQVVQFNNLL